MTGTTLPSNMTYRDRRCGSRFRLQSVQGSLYNYTPEYLESSTKLNQGGREERSDPTYETINPLDPMMDPMLDPMMDPMMDPMIQ
mmetsp:Transcript_12715/g.15359  ORF Transcript_12715/g.15359 Transcript_12715/m.15359 type:complete len:85 (-) Transcript_12715:2546-2800(-)